MGGNGDDAVCKKLFIAKTLDPEFCAVNIQQPHSCSSHKTINTLLLSDILDWPNA